MTNDEMIQHIAYLEWVIRVKNEKIARLTDQVIQGEDWISRLQDELTVTRDDLDVFAATVDTFTLPSLDTSTAPVDPLDDLEWQPEMS